MKDGWHFLSFRWWLVHLLGFSLVYAAARLNSLWFTWWDERRHTFSAPCPHRLALAWLLWQWLARGPV